ncbi:MAG: peptidylprolyl isomerase [Bacteroidales bacterium]|nr:peptidylprolyl isomerase [Bacteroidales bacterium]
MKKFNLLFFAFFWFVSAIFAQKEDTRTLLTIGDEKITVSQFLYVFDKNNGRAGVDDTTSMSDYLDLFVNFRLKVKEAEELGMDTSKSFTTELAGYRTQLAQPYLVDKDVNEVLLEEAYNRLQYNIRASHIMKRIPENMDDEDSLAKAAYNSLLEIRKKAMKGEDFAALAKEHSDDPSARDRAADRNYPARKGNGGDLGYFTAFYMVYPFENAAYNTPVGEISMPIRTKYGYHLVKVTDKIEALGTIHAAHILVNNTNQSLVAKTKIDEIRAEILNNAITFEQAAMKYSDDRGSAEKGGELNWFEVSRMVPDFIKGISEIDSIGGISQPIETEYGYHLIKLLDLRKTPPYNEYLPELKTKVAKDSRSNKSREVAVERFKKEYKFKEYPKALQEFYSVVDSSIFEKNWKATAASSLTKPLFVLNKKKFTQKQFAAFVESNQRSMSKGTIKYMIHNLYNQWVTQMVLNEKSSNLEKEDFNFRMLMNEYHDGILLFNISDEKIWSKAISDTVGLSAFLNQNQSNYMWKPRVDAEIYRVKNDSIAHIVKNYLNAGMPLDSVIRLTNSNSSLNVGFERGKYEEGDNTIIDKAEKKVGVQRIENGDKLIFLVRINQLMEASPKKLSEARGLITADYQNYLHDEWINSLRQKYTVEINQKVFDSLEK